MAEENEIPIGFIGFLSDFEFAETCSFCSDLDFDVLEIFVNVLNFYHLFY